tara:strand:+ start:22160 stop:22861 length:702 start_codon:yes stop_codon:yes gene_type:complete
MEMSYEYYIKRKNIEKSQQQDRSEIVEEYLKNKKNDKKIGVWSPDDSQSFYKSDQWIKLRDNFVNRYDRGYCWNCKRTWDKFVIRNVDHIMPIKRRPDLKLNEDNLQILCNSCNKEKNNFYGKDVINILEVFRRHLWEKFENSVEIEDFIDTVMNNNDHSKCQICDNTDWQKYNKTIIYKTPITENWNKRFDINNVWIACSKCKKNSDEYYRVISIEEERSNIMKEEKDFNNG